MNVGKLPTSLTNIKFEKSSEAVTLKNKFGGLPSCNDKIPPLNIRQILDQLPVFNKQPH